MAASLTSIDEIAQLAGVHHITVSPRLLAELAATTEDSVEEEQNTLFRRDAQQQLPVVEVPLEESAWRMAFTRSKAGRSEEKIIQAINIFADMQDRLEGLVREFQA
jgi:transaldolase